MPDALRFDLRALLEGVEANSPTRGVEAVAAELASTVGAVEVSFLIADLLGGSLARLAHTQPTGEPAEARSAPETVPIEDTAAGMALRTQRVQVREVDDHVQVCAPVTARGEAVGVLEMLLAAEPDDQTLAYLAEAAHALAYVVIADRRYTDLYEWGQRSMPMSLEAEIQRRLLPDSFTCEAGRFTLACWQVPANKAGGDTFDFSLDRDTLHLSVTDAMGHGVIAAQLATLTVASLRNSRRADVGIVEQAQRANEAMTEHARPDEHLTGLLVRVDLATGLCEIVNAGHVPALLMRHGKVRDVELAADLPFGILPEVAYRLQTLQLEPGDRLVLLTDGMLERNAAEAHVLTLLEEAADLHPREVVQLLTRAVLKATDDDLRDDATVMVVDWYGGEDLPRDAVAGASDDRASD